MITAQKIKPRPLINHLINNMNTFRLRVSNLRQLKQ